MAKRRTVKKCVVNGVADARIVAEVVSSEAWEHPTFQIRLTMEYGIYSANTTGEISDPHEIGSEEKTTVVISCRDRGDSENDILARALRWVANQIEFDPEVTLTTIDGEPIDD